MAGQTYSNSPQFYGNQLSDVLRLAVEPLCKFRQLADSQISAGRHRGNTMTWSIMGDITTPGGALNENTTMPVGSLTIAQGTLTVSEFGQAVNWSRFLEDLSKFSIEDSLGVALTNDCAKTLDRTGMEPVQTDGHSAFSKLKQQLSCLVVGRNRWFA